MLLRLRIDRAYEESLADHLRRQGFPPTRGADGGLHVLFPCDRALFAAAVDLDLWIARGGCAESLSLEVGAPALAA
jgi:hypothetical protein